MNIPYPHNITDLEKSNSATYILIDCAHFDHKFYKDLYKEDKLNFKSLFLGTPDELSAFAGPVLIQVDQGNDTNFISKVLKVEQEKPAVVWLWSEKKFEEIYNLFQSLLYAKLPDGTNALCRFYDSRGLEVFLEFFKRKDEKLNEQLQNISTWAFFSKNSYIYLS